MLFKQDKHKKISKKISKWNINRLQMDDEDNCSKVMILHRKVLEMKKNTHGTNFKGFKFPIIPFI